MKTWLVAHRGAQKNAKENTMSAFRDAQKFSVGYIELDVRVTSDDVAIIHHDAAIGEYQIADVPFEKLRALDPELAHFDEVVKASHEQPLIVELKSTGTAVHVANYLHTHPESFATSFIIDELQKLSDLGIATNRMFLAQHKHPLGHIKKARDAGFRGVTLNKWYLTPLFYVRAQRANVTIFIYTVNSRWWAACVRTLYPRVLIGTDRPDLLQDLA